MGRASSRPRESLGILLSIPESAYCKRIALLRLGGGEGVMARIVERAEAGRTGLDGAEPGEHGRKCADMFIMMMVTAVKPFLVLERYQRGECQKRR